MTRIRPSAAQAPAVAATQSNPALVPSGARTSRSVTTVGVGGFGPVAETLLQNGLLDELRLWVHPVFAGVGEPSDLLFRADNSSKLELVDNRTLGSGIVTLSYRSS
ncbi:MAG: hypothetical protein ACRDK0_03265 [Solirubrobacteraceae bacterium]